MYITCPATSPCAKIVARLGKVTTFLATPAESRKFCASKRISLAGPYLRGNADFAMVVAFILAPRRAYANKIQICAQMNRHPTPSLLLCSSWGKQKGRSEEENPSRRPEPSRNSRFHSAPQRRISSRTNHRNKVNNQVRPGVCMRRKETKRSCP